MGFLQHRELRKPVPMDRLKHDMIFINLPVTDLDKSRNFYAGLGFVENKTFSDERTSSFEVNASIVVMLLQSGRFQEFSNRPVTAAGGSREVLNCLSVASPADADELASRVRACGGVLTKEPAADGPMYGGSFDDPDGHGWEFVYMDPEAFA